VSILPPRRHRRTTDWFRRVYISSADLADPSTDLDEDAERCAAGYGFGDFAGRPYLPDDLAERLEADLDHDAQRAGGGE
jgi:hypothetical protein